MSVRTRTKSPARLGRVMQPVEAIPCMFCLSDTPPTIKYDGPCDCKPHVHKRCLTTWFKKTPNECPLCRKDYDPLSEVEEEPLPIVIPELQQRNYNIIVFNRQIHIPRNYYTVDIKYIVCSVILLYVSAWLESY